MKKVNIKLASGISDAKTVINAFKNEENTYVVFDNEAVGSMGLPIILIAKLVNDRLVKIPDQTEWQKVKEFLKSIIAGDMVDWINVPDELPAEDVYSTQLTLPLLSFDALKENYKPIEPIDPDAGPARAINVVIDPNSAPIAPTPAPVKEVAPEPVVPIISPAMPDISAIAAPISVAPVMPPVVEAPVMPVVPEVTPEQVPPVAPIAPVAPVVEMPVIAPVVPEPVAVPPVVEMPQPAVEPVVIPAPVVPEPVVAPVIPVVEPPVVSPVIEPIAPVVPTPVMPVVPEPVVAPVVEPVVPVAPVVPEISVPPVVPVAPAETNNYDELKETFMKSCENMFDALIAKLK